jgi:hypothetical protein
MNKKNTLASPFKAIFYDTSCKTVQVSTTFTYGSQTKLKLHGLSPQANYTDRATAACRRSDYQLLRIEGVTWSE